MKSSGWVIVVFEGEYRNFDGEVAYVKGPFQTWEAATEWAENSTDCPGKVGVDAEWQITFLESVEARS
jgi:hypothetical protein